MRYYFDLRQGQELAVDEEGKEFATLQKVQEEAARSLADMARDATLTTGGNGTPPNFAIEVRDDTGPVLQVSFNLKMDRKS